MKAFKINDGHGFSLTFKNGVRLSTQFGWMNYCDNENRDMPITTKMAKNDWESNDAEIAIFSPTGEWITRQFEDNGDDVLGRVSMEKWLKALEFCKKWKPKTRRRKK